eukprot:CAMPEP_0117552062 /NCGR_PEP_ID=MMETSP0784-20121206/49515_1 /TAXON_ID=39447 /ORGANISM="" /LENGTH=279 /DNA_ID=CAMNT_0005349125 /DNA_START=164 /DNA_END=1000 /DNA_ORIENTATION=+
MNCWMGVLTFEFCCTGEYGVGNPICWDDDYTWEACCKPQLGSLAVQLHSVDPSTSSALLVVNPEQGNASDNATRLLTGDEIPGALTNMFFATTAPANSPRAERHRAQARCINEYDDPNYRKWFLSQSGIPTHPMVNYGNPDGCVQGGHGFWWAVVEIQQGVVDLESATPTFDSVKRDLEFGFCVPASCDFATVEFLLMPFYLGPYLNKPWGPSPIWIENLAAPSSSEGLKDHTKTPPALLSDWAKEIKITPGYMQRYWPYNCGIWRYKASWSLSTGNRL